MSRRSSLPNRRGLGPSRHSEQELNALEAALEKSESGRRLLTLLSEAARLRLHEALAGEARARLSRGCRAARRVLCGRDLIARERAVAQLPHAETTLANWQRALSDYQTQREIVEYAMRDLMRAFV